jgi:hypothetical protein
MSFADLAVALDEKRTREGKVDLDPNLLPAKNRYDKVLFVTARPGA